MKTLFAAVLLASTVVSFGAANAAGGCGPGFHRGPYGGCRANGVVVVAPPVVVERPVVVVPRGSRLPLWFRLALWALPRDLSADRTTADSQGAASATPNRT